ncbi:MAG: hypothetical protein AB3N20_05470 [Rhizobiaceae bacterium]
MRKMILAMIFAAASSNALALERLYSANITCDQVKSVLERDGAAIIYYPSRSIPGLNLINRFVKTANFCESAKRALPFAIKTRDTNVCKVPICREQKDDSFN